MVYASTRIKRTAAAAFEPEAVETDDYVIQKPEGFLNVLGGDARYAFEAYSKEYGTGDAEKFRQGRATLTINAADAATADEVTSSRTEVIDGDQYQTTEAIRRESGIEFVVVTRRVEKGDRRYSFEAVRLAETSDEFARKIEQFVESFRLK